MKKLLSFLIILTLVGLSCTNKSDQIISDQAISKIDSTLNHFMETEAVGGVSAMIFEDGKEVYFNAFGWADRNDQIEMDRNTIVQIYSMTKPITGVALMQLFEKGEFQLDDPVADYLPEFTNLQVFEGMDTDGEPILVEPKRPMTIRDLTRHTSGFVNDTNHPYVGNLLEEAEPLHHTNTLTEFAEKLGSLPLIFHPGEEWYYGPSVDVQAYIVEVLSGQSFETYLRKNVLDPLGMNETRYYVPEEDRGRMASAFYISEDDSLIQISDETQHAFNINEVRLKPGGWGLTSTLDDYMKFTQMLVNDGTLNGTQILKPETVKLMATNHLSDKVTNRIWLPSKGQVGFGIDFAVRLHPPASLEENMGVVGEFFWDGAASTLFWVDPENNLTSVFYVQKFPFDGRLHKDFRDAVYYELLKNRDLTN